MSTDTPPPENPRKSRFGGRLRFLMGFVIFLALVYTGAWFFGARMVRDQIEQALAGYTSEATSANCADIDITGFPFRYDVSCTGLEITEGDVSVALPGLKATVLVYRPTHLLWSAQGPATYQDAFTGTRQQLRWSQLYGSARTNGWALARVSIEGEAFSLIDTLLGERELGTLARFEAHALDMPEQYNELTARSEIAVLVDMVGIDLAELDVADGSVRLEAEVPGVPDDVRRWTLPTLVANWRDDPIRLISLRAEDAQSEIDIVGTIGTTSDAYLTGDFDLTTRNVNERISAIIAPQMLDIFLGQPSDDGSYYRAYSLRDGVLLAGNLPIMVTPPLL